MIKKVTIFLFLFISVYNQNVQKAVSPLDIEIVDITVDTSKVSQVKISTNLSYDFMAFEQDNAVYISKFESGIYIENDKGQIVFNDIVTKKLKVNGYDETNNKNKKNQITFLVNLEAGSYYVKSFIYDLLSRENYSKTVQYIIDAPYSSKRMLSKLRLYNLNNGDREIVRENRFYDNDGKIEIEFYSFNPSNIDNLSADIEIGTLDDVTLFKKTVDNILYDENKRAIIFTVLSKSELKSSRATIHVTLRQDRTKLDEMFTPIFFSWRIIPRTDEDMTEALKQMEYIVEPDTLSYFLKAGLDQQKAFFKRFWINSSALKTETDGKALQNEYFERVNYTNQHFSRNFKKLKFEGSGWKSDRGRIYIKFGPPDQMSDINVETLGSFKNYSISWNYKLLQKKFIFYRSRKSGVYTLDGKSENAEHSL